MSFRFEEKCLIDLQNQSLLMKYLDQLMVKPLFSSRNISSIYFDNLNKEMFLNSEEGTVPRKKIRIRSYENLLDSSLHFEKNFEIKYTYEDFREKKVEPLSIQTFQNTYYDNIYGLCSKIFFSSNF